MTFHAEGLHGEARRSRSSNYRNQLTDIVHTETQSGFSMYFFVLYPRYHLFLFFVLYSPVEIFPVFQYNMGI